MQEIILQHLLERLNANTEWKYQINVNDWQTDFLRFYDSQTNYNISKQNTSVDVSVYKDKKSYSFSIDQPTIKKIDKAVDITASLIDSLPEDPDFVDVETDLKKKTGPDKKNIIHVIPLDRKIFILKEIAAAADKLGFDIFGTFICNFQHTRILNSNKLDKEQTNSPIYFEVKAVQRDRQVTVLHTYGGESYRNFRLDRFISQLNEKMTFAGYEITDVEPGEYDVVFAPRCIAELMLYLSGSMTAMSYDQKSSYFEQKLNEQVFPDYINIIDDPDDKDIISFFYNGDGHVYNRLPLIENGVFTSFMCNNYYSHKTGLPKNGNSGACLVLHPGSVALDEMIGSVKRGLYISSLHYMNFINEKETSVTGLTRDGTFLIEDGKITKVVNNLRYTDKIVRIFQSITKLENQCQTVPFSDNYEFFDISCAKAPHVLVKDFNITSSTKTI